MREFVWSSTRFNRVSRMRYDASGEVQTNEIMLPRKVGTAAQIIPYAGPRRGYFLPPVRRGAYGVSSLLWVCTTDLVTVAVGALMGRASGTGGQCYLYASGVRWWERIANVWPGKVSVDGQSGWLSWRYYVA